MKNISALSVFSMVLCGLLLPVWRVPAPAYGKHLTDEAVRDAYFLGQDADRCAEFLKQYMQALPVPATGPHVSQVELQTPYAQIVSVSRQHVTAYSAQQALLDYKSRGDTFLVRVQVMFTPTYTNRLPDFWHDVSIGLIQNDQHNAATSVTGQTIYANGYDGSAWPIGANIYATFSAHGIASDSVDIEVVPPEGATVHATFNLASLQ